MILVDDYELVPIEYKRGPSYLLSADDFASFAALVERLRAAGDPAFQPVGFFRSHTRDAPCLGEEDIQLLDQFFPEPDAVVLWIRPFATKVGIAGFLFRENGAFPEGPPAPDFPFRRKDLAPGEAVAGGARASRNREAPAPDVTVMPPSEAAPSHPLPPRGQLESAPPAASAKSWYWLPLSFCFLLLGVFLGFLAALNFQPQPPAVSEYFTVGLAAENSGDDVHVKWDRQAPAIRAAQRGVLTIEDGHYSKTLDLDSSQLQNGSVVYRRSSNSVHFRLQLFTGSRDTLTETVEWP